jgi:hypothetical protein
MPTLEDQIDRFSNAARAIRSSATLISTSFPEDGGPFTRAVLDIPLGDLIRDADPSELGLFTLVHRQSGVPRDTDSGAPSEVARIEIMNATPLRKQTSIRQDIPRAREPEPEVYAHAALKYINR